MQAPKYPKDPLRELGSARRAYVLPQYKLLYISVAKNACTSIKWMIAALAGEDLEAMRPTLGFYPNRQAGVHDRLAWHRTPRLNEVGRQVRRDISPDNGWMVFGVVRDPRTRLFSAWENKYLLRNPAYWHKVDRPWHPRIPTKPQDVIEDFARFVSELEGDPQHEAVQTPLDDSGAVKGDAHFRSQSQLLADHVVPYSHLYDISELQTMVSDVTDHARKHGYDGPPLSLPSSNDTPLTANREVFAGGVRESIERIYVDDFARFGDRWDFSRVESRDLDWSEHDFALVATIISANERIADLARTARRLNRRYERLVTQSETLAARVEELERRPAALHWRARKALGRLRSG